MLLSVSLFALVVSCLTSLSFSLSLSFDRGACQSVTNISSKPHAALSPPAACPPGTFLVGPPNSTAPFHSVQSAILTFETSVSSNKSKPTPHNPGTILILPGTYYEQLNITTAHPLILLGATTSPNNASANLVTIQYNQATGNAINTFDNAYTSVLTIAPSLNSSLTGSGPTGNPVPANTPFGNTDFRTYNIDFVNGYAPYAAGPALAVSVSYANAGFYYSGFYSYQDTVYVGKLGNAWWNSSVIAGQTDFLYGFGTAWVQSSTLLLRSCGGAIAAWKGTNTTFANKYGVYAHDSRVLKANDSLRIEGKCALGRPWNAGHRSIFANSYFDDSVRPAGYIEWSASTPNIGVNTTMATYEDYGPGWNVTAERESGITEVMTRERYVRYSEPGLVFQEPFSGELGHTHWIDDNPIAQCDGE